MRALILHSLAALILSGAAPAAPAWELPPVTVITLPATDPLLNKASLDRVKRHILSTGERSSLITNKYNQVPVWTLPPYRLHLEPDPPAKGQPWNINCDPAHGDFHTLVIDLRDAPPLTGVIDFRPKEAIRFRAYDRLGQMRQDDTEQALALFRRAFSAALEAIDSPPAASPSQ